MMVMVLFADGGGKAQLGGTSRTNLGTVLGDCVNCRGTELPDDGQEIGVIPFTFDLGLILVITEVMLQPPGPNCNIMHTSSPTDVERRQRTLIDVDPGGCHSTTSRQFSGEDIELCELSRVIHDFVGATTAATSRHQPPYVDDFTVGRVLAENIAFTAREASSIDWHATTSMMRPSFGST